MRAEYAVAEINKKLLYVQVTYLLHSEEVIAREYGNLEKIRDNWPKIVVSLDDVSFSNKNGIQHVQAWRFAEFLKKIEEISCFNGGHFKL